jgi:hypothetical protein
VKDIQTSYLTEWKNLLKSKYNLRKWRKVNAISYIHVVVLLWLQVEESTSTLEGTHDTGHLTYPQQTTAQFHQQDVAELDSTSETEPQSSAVFSTVRKVLRSVPPNTETIEMDKEPWCCSIYSLCIIHIFSCLSFCFLCRFLLNFVPFLSFFFWPMYCLSFDFDYPFDIFKIFLFNYSRTFLSHINL